jgi:DNA-binding protein YbaB
MIRTFTMSDADCDQAASFIRKRVFDGGYVDKITGLVTAENLRTFKDLHVELAEVDGELVGYLSWQITYSTWRGLTGIYINDQFASAGDKDVLQSLLARAMARGMAQGASYIRTEADITEEHLTDTYAEAGFWHVIRRAQYYLEAKAFAARVEKMKITPLA